MYEFYTYGDATNIVTILNAVSGIVRGNDFVGLLKIATALGFILIIIESTIKGNLIASNAKYIATVTIIATTLIGVKVDVKVVDKLSPTKTRVVNNVPFALGALAGFSSSIGQGLTKLYETSFSIPGDRKFEKNGLLFGSKLLNDNALFEIRDEEFKRSVGDFSYQCIVMGAGLGLVSFGDLKNSDDIWQLAKTRLAQKSRFYSHWEKSGAGVKRELLTCAEGIAKLEPKWNAIVAEATTYYGKRRNPGMTNLKAKTLLLSNLPIAYSSVLKVSKNAQEIMRQAMLINALQTGGVHE